MSSQQVYGDYCVDIVLCIDATGSMQPIIDEVKNNALSFHEKFVRCMDDAGKDVEQLRVKVIVFRDYICDSQPMVESDFYVLPDEQDKFHRFVEGIEACGGGDVPENALEAIALAMKSDWTRDGEKRRHAILVFSDAPALELGKRKDMPGYPTGLPKTLAELGAWWAGTDQYFTGSFQAKNGRLVAFVPKMSPWSEMVSWNRYWPAYSKAGTGLSDVDIMDALDLLVGSIN